jgi:hypothetical protein
MPGSKRVEGLTQWIKVLSLSTARQLEVQEKPLHTVQGPNLINRMKDVRISD